MSQPSARVVRVSSAHDGAVSWTVLDEASCGCIVPIEDFLAFLTAIGRSPNTVRAYAFDLRDFFHYLSSAQLTWDDLTLEQVGAFVSWLQLPPAGRGGQVAVLPMVAPHVSASTVNRKLAAVSSFYDFHARRGVEVPALWQWSRGRQAGSFVPMLAHLGARSTRRRVVSLKVDRGVPQVLSSAQIDAVLGSCVRLRDRFLFMLLRDTGLRIGEALGLRHGDLNARRREVSVRFRENANGARAKTVDRTVPVPDELLCLYSDYLHEEYGDLDSDYVFLTLWSKPVGVPLTYSALNSLVRRLRARSGVMFEPHFFRHTYATNLLRRGTPAEVVAKLLGHASVATTTGIYGHLSPDDLREALVAVGVLPPLGDDRRAVGQAPRW